MIELELKFRRLIVILILVSFSLGWIQLLLVPPLPHFEDYGAGCWAYQYLFGFGPVYLEIDYEENCDPDADAVNYLIWGFNQVSRRFIVPLFELWNERPNWDFNTSEIEQTRDCPNDYNHLYILYNDEERLEVYNSAFGGLVWDASTILLANPNDMNSIQEANRLLHELGHILGLFHPSESPHLHMFESRNCIMNSISNNQTLQFFCPSCQIQLLLSSLVIINVLVWISYHHNIEECRLKREFSRQFETAIMLFWLVSIFFIGYFKWQKQRKKSITKNESV